MRHARAGSNATMSPTAYSVVIFSPPTLIQYRFGERVMWIGTRPDLQCSPTERQNARSWLGKRCNAGEATTNNAPTTKARPIGDAARLTGAAIAFTTPVSRPTNRVIGPPGPSGEPSTSSRSSFLAVAQFSTLRRMIVMKGSKTTADTQPMRIKTPNLERVCWNHLPIRSIPPLLRPTHYGCQVAPCA